ncbi:MAG: Type II secretion system protein I [Glaciecola sp. HTCC2999]|nr:MAG: Type II secretion system protein I [Glaciecola sp. HTCC2999]
MKPEFQQNLARQRGMTLIEVMVALLIFGLAGTAVMKAATENLTSVSQLQDITLATFVANNRLTQLHLEQEWPIRNNQKGDMEIAEVKWYWQQTVTKTQENDLVQVRISVAVDAEYQQMVTDVVSFFGKPSTSGGL